MAFSLEDEQRKSFLANACHVCTQVCTSMRTWHNTRFASKRCKAPLSSKKSQLTPRTDPYARWAKITCQMTSPLKIYYAYVHFWGLSLIKRLLMWCQIILHLMNFKEDLNTRQSHLCIGEKLAKLSQLKVSTVLTHRIAAYWKSLRYRRPNIVLCICIFTEQ